LRTNSFANAEKTELTDEFDVAIVDTGITMDTGNVVMDVFHLKERNEEIFAEWLNTMKFLPA